MIYWNNILSNNFLRLFFTIFFSNIYCRVFIFCVKPKLIADFYTNLGNLETNTYYLWFSGDSKPFFSLIYYLSKFFKTEDILIFLSSLSLAIVINAIYKSINNNKLFYQRIFLLLILPITPVLMISILRFSLSQSIAISLLLSRNNNSRFEEIKKNILYVLSFMIHPTVLLTYFAFMNPFKYVRIFCKYFLKYFYKFNKIIDSKIIKKKDLLILAFIFIFLISLIFLGNILLYQKIIDIFIPYLEKFVRYISVAFRFDGLSLIFLYLLCIYVIYYNCYNFKNKTKYKSFLYGSFIFLILYIINPIFWRFSIFIFIITIGYSKIIPRYFYFISLIYSTYFIYRYFFY